MKWVKLIGGRFLDFLITGAVVALLCIGLVQFRGRISPLSQQEVDYFEQKYGRPVEPTDQQLEPKEPDKLPGAIRRATRKVIRVLSIAIGLFGVISVFGIVFRREGLTQREGFVRVWVGVPKYFTQYFAGYFRKSNTGGE